MKSLYLNNKNRYLNLLNITSQSGGAEKSNDKDAFVILRDPHPLSGAASMDAKYHRFVDDLQKHGDVFDYIFNFDLNENKSFTVEDLSLENVAEDIHKKYKNHNRIFLISVGYATPYALYYSNKYYRECVAVICYQTDLRLKQKMLRLAKKYDDDKVWENEITDRDIVKYLFDINNDRLKELLSDKDNKTNEEILALVTEYNIYKQYKKIPKVFNIPTYLYVVIDNIEDTTDIEKEDMGNITAKNARIYSYYSKLIKKNSETKYLKIQYIPRTYVQSKYVDYYPDIMDRIRSMLWAKCV